MKIQLRDYQASLTSSIFDSLSHHQRVIAQLPTGGGKTICFSYIANEFVQMGARVLVLAHRQELLTQAAGKLTALTGMPVGMVKAGVKPDYQSQIQVASVQSLVRRLDKLPAPDLIIVDEAHHATAKTYTKILDAYPKTFVLGVTATPTRCDGKGFDHLFNELICGPSVAELMKQGYLSPYRLFADANPMSTRGVRKQGGDYSVSDLARENDPIKLSGNLVKSYRQHADGLKNIVFALNVEHSKAIVERYQSEGIPAAHLDGTSTDEERTKTLEAFRCGNIKVLSNVGLFGEGFDVPSIEAVQIARPTQSLALHLQMLGRGLRPAEGKSHAVFIDHTGNWWNHGLPDEDREWSLTTPPKKPRTQLERSETGEVKPALEPPVIVETDTNLVEIIRPDAEDMAAWERLWNQLVQQQKSNGYKRGWLRFALEKRGNPPLEIWQKCAAHLGYKRGWAWYRYMDSQKSAA